MADVKIKACAMCRLEKPEDEFYTRAANVKEAVCNVCYMIRRYPSLSTRKGYLNRLFIQSRSNNRKSGRADWNIELQDLINLWDSQEGRCALSGVYMTHHKDGLGVKEFNASIDRISPKSGYIVGNVQLVAYRVNIMKHTLSEDLFFWWVKNILKNMST